MRRTFLSIVIGLAVGCLLLAAAFCVFSLASPGWLRAALGGEEAPPGPVVLLPSPAPTNKPKPPTPTPIPLPTVPGACGGPEQMTIALLGVDDRSTDYSRAPRTDAISLIHVWFTAKSASMLSFPRDLYVPLPNLESTGIYQDRLNTAYLYGEIYAVPGGGPTQLKDTMALNFGVRVDRYVLVNFGAFEAGVDALGGVDIDVPEAIYDPDYPADDGTGSTFVLQIPAGLQHMDGQAALRYARTRHQDDDYHRIQRQQLVLLAIRDKLINPKVVPQIPALISVLGSLAHTDLSAQEIAALACIGPQIDRSNIKAQVIDGTMVIPWTTPTGGRVSIPNRDEIAPVVSAFLGQ